MGRRSTGWIRSGPDPLPTVTDADGLDHQWVTGMVGASCIDSEDRIVTVNRGFLPGGLLPQEGSQSIPAPPVVVYDREGNVADSWGDPALTDDGAAAFLPHGIHGCFVDYLDNVWIAGNSDGVVQKWSRDGSEMLLQIGTKGLCDGPPTTEPQRPLPDVRRTRLQLQRDAAERAGRRRGRPAARPGNRRARLRLHRRRLR